MAVAWPTGYPKPLIDGWSLEPAPLTIRSEMEAGAARVRRISSQRNDKVTAQFNFSRINFHNFRVWYSDVARDGAEWIEMPIFVGQSFDCSTTETVRFIGQWTATALNAAKTRILVAAELEVRG